MLVGEIVEVVEELSIARSEAELCQLALFVHDTLDALLAGELHHQPRAPTSTAISCATAGEASSSAAWPAPESETPPLRGWGTAPPHRGEADSGAQGAVGGRGCRWD